MITIELNKYSVEDVKYIQKLQAMGVPDYVIQMAYDSTNQRRKDCVTMTGKIKCPCGLREYMGEDDCRGTDCRECCPISSGYYTRLEKECE